MVNDRVDKIKELQICVACGRAAHEGGCKNKDVAKAN